MYSIIQEPKPRIKLANIAWLLVILIDVLILALLVGLCTYTIKI